MFRRMKNFLGAVEVKKFSKIQYIRNLRSGLTDTRDFKITFFVCLSFNKKIGGTWSPPRHLVRKIWHQTHVLKATAMRLEFLKNFWVSKNTTEASQRGKIRRTFWVDRNIIFEKTNIFSFSSRISLAIQKSWYAEWKTLQLICARMIIEKFHEIYSTMPPNFSTLFGP